MWKRKLRNKRNFSAQWKNWKRHWRRNGTSDDDWNPGMTQLEFWNSLIAILPHLAHFAHLPHFPQLLAIFPHFLPFTHNFAPACRRACRMQFSKIQARLHASAKCRSSMQIDAQSQKTYGLYLTAGCKTSKVHAFLTLTGFCTLTLTYAFFRIFEALSIFCHTI